MEKIENAIKIGYNDNVAVSLNLIKKDTDIFNVTAIEDIIKGHKVALRDIKAGEHIVKYGLPIGHATVDIQKGSHVHTHNLKTNLKGILDYSYNPILSDVFSKKEGSFLGYVRKDGKAAIRNEIWIINTVGCVNKISERLSDLANKKFEGLTDGIFTFTHPFGCSQLGDDHVNTQKILADMVNHPNAAGVLVLGLGCENNNIPSFKKFMNEYNGYDDKRVKFLITQDVDSELETGLDIIEELVKYAQTFKREPIPISKLVVGLKCGGSDGLSGITANPLVGSVSDELIRYGATSILTEVPEMFGAEQLLMNRCETVELFDKTVLLINDFKNYFIKYNQEIYENPSPGNKDGGISTLEDKSLGCIQKGGTSSISDVLGYGDVVSKNGLNLLTSPGNDAVAITTLMAAGAHIVLFTTGRGTPIGSAVPTVKISTNTELYNKKSSWIDFNAGGLVEDVSMESLTDDFIKYLINVAEGTIRTKNEINGYREISIFKDGVTL